MTTPARDSIRHLTVQWRGPSAEARTPAAALRLERQFDAVEWRPSALKPGQILLIRRLRGLPPLRVGQGWAMNWEAAVREEVMRLYLRAARAGSGLAADAESILFEDSAELLISLTQEVVRQPALVSGGVGLPWYWSQVLDTPAPARPGSLLTALWVQYAAHLPRALMALPSPVVEAALRSLSPAEVHLVLQALAEAFSTLPPSLPATTVDSSTSQPLASRAEANLPATSGTPSGLPAEAPWSRWLPLERIRHLPHGRLGQTLLGWSAALAHQPAYAVTATFRQQISDWYSHPADNLVPLLPAQVATDQPVTSPARRVIAPTPGADESTLTTSKHHQTQALDEAELNPLDETLLVEPVITRPEGELTGLAGLFFLIHLLPWLKQFSGYAEYWNPWHLLAMLGRALLHPLSPVDERDPIWALLDRLTEGELPPENLEAWMNAFSGAVLTRLQISLPEVEDVGAFLLRRTGRVYISRTHLDLDLPMEQADVRLRRAGLDFNPGWVPTLGYIVHFHYLDEGVS